MGLGPPAGNLGGGAGCNGGTGYTAAAGRRGRHQRRQFQGGFRGKPATLCGPIGAGEGGSLALWGHDRCVTR